jgi:CRP/FNR family transcriptional regulator, cyclic AMP receptor protein
MPTATLGLIPGSPGTADILTELARLGDTRTWEPGEIVVTEGDPADCMYVIHHGELRVFVSGEGGREVELSTLGPGEFFGELMLGVERRTASVQTTARTQLTRVTRAALERLVQDRPDLAFLLIQSLVARVRALTRTVRDLASMDVYGRLVGLFDALAQEERGVRFVPGPLSQQRIADRVGASRAMVHKLLHDLEKGGYVTLGKERIVLLKKLPRRW